MPIIVHNRWFPFNGFACCNIFGILFTRREWLSDTTLRHEGIHTEQMKEMLFVPFYVWYLLEWLVRLILFWDGRKAYKKIAFEQEAYAHEKDTEYKRKHYAWFKYLCKR